MYVLHLSHHMYFLHLPVPLSIDTFQAANERNYHVFYELLMGLTGEEKKKYGLKSASEYFYLNQASDKSYQT